MIISILNEKGGCGKTTLSINIARCLTKRGHKTLLIDSDVQASARTWHNSANGELLDVVGIDMPTIDKDARKLKAQYDYIIIDGTPRISPITAKSVICAQLVMIPVSPSPLDIWGAERVANLVEEQFMKGQQEQPPYINTGSFSAGFIISNSKANTKISKEIEDALKQYNLYTFKSRTSSRTVYASCLAEGTTVFESEGYGAIDAQKEIESIVDEILSLTGVANVA